MKNGARNTIRKEEKEKIMTNYIIPKSFQLGGMKWALDSIIIKKKKSLLLHSPVSSIKP